MRDRIDSPGYVPDCDGSQGEAPGYGLETAEKVVDKGLSQSNLEIILFQEVVELLSLQVFAVRGIEKKDLSF